ncbi:hypothetical protein llap_22903 [Limosa lapponica baueri]|uniref:Uncharacterized protein n=1 Tax=Limosa lapponica baueri TaxID=1758121 RepID=A0A2I0SZ14_LIMLA|nr:hypothetical protein llap_22903 [Limosa lapponica baueri]
MRIRDVDPGTVGSGPSLDPGTAWFREQLNPKTIRFRYSWTQDQSGSRTRPYPRTAGSRNSQMQDHGLDLGPVLIQEYPGSRNNWIHDQPGSRIRPNPGTVGPRTSQDLWDCFLGLAVTCPTPGE